MIKSFAAVHLCYPAISVSYLMCWALQKIRCTNKIKFWGLTPFCFRICLMIYFCLTGSCPPIFLGRKQRPPTQAARCSATKLQPPAPAGCRWHKIRGVWSKKISRATRPYQLYQWCSSLTTGNFIHRHLSKHRVFTYLMSMNFNHQHLPKDSCPPARLPHVGSEPQQERILQATACIPTHT